jgi:hypothetical protein
MSNTELKAYTTKTETLCKQQTTSPKHQKHFVLLLKKKEFLPNLLTFIKLLIAKYSEHFLLYRNIIPPSTPPSNNSYNESTTKKHTNCQIESSKKHRSTFHIRVRQRECEAMSKKFDKNTERKSNSDNYHLQIVALKDHFLTIIPPEFIYYQLTIHCRRDNLYRTAFKADSIKNVIETVYKRINETIVHPKRYAQLPHKKLMPYLLAMIEFDDKVLFHAHCLLAVHPDTAEAFDELRIYDEFQQFDSRISSSHFERLIADAKDIKTFNEPTNLSHFINYMFKKNKNTKIIKSPDNLIVLAPKQ